MLGYTPVDLKY